MFELTKNQFLQNNTCNYTDEFGNTAFMKRTEDGITCKLRFSDQRVKTEPLNIKIPAPEEEKGKNLKLNYSNAEALNENSVKVGISNFTALINYWMNMICDIALLDVKNTFFMKVNPDATEQEIWQHKMKRIAPYKELESLVNYVDTVGR